MGCEVVLEEWGCASEIKQNLNKIKATPCKLAEVLSVYSTLPKVVARRASTSRTGSVSHTGNYSNQDSALWSNFLEHQLCQSLRWKSDSWAVRKETENFGRGEGEILMKKGCKKGGGSL